MVTDQGLEEACNATTFDNFYKKLFSMSKDPDIRESIIRFDKTPRYISDFESIHSKYRVPAIVAIKDPRLITLSDFKRSGLPLADIKAWYKEWLPKKISYMKQAYAGYNYAWTSPDCLVVRLEDMCFSPLATAKRMFAHIGIDFHPSYFRLTKKRTSNTHGSSISTAVAVAHFHELPNEISEDISNDFSCFPEWFYKFDC